MEVAVVESSHIWWKQNCKGCKPNTDLQFSIDIICAIQIMISDFFVTRKKNSRNLLLSRVA